MSSNDNVGFPTGTGDERQLLLSWLTYLRGAIERNLAGVTDEQAQWRPDEVLISLLGIVNHLTRVEWRWIDGGILGRETVRDEAEFEPGPELSVVDALAAYRARAAATDAVVLTAPNLFVPCRMQSGTDLRWVLLHLINETARHAGHADSVRELLDGTRGE